MILPAPSAGTVNLRGYEARPHSVKRCIELHKRRRGRDRRVRRSACPAAARQRQASQQSDRQHQQQQPAAMPCAITMTLMFHSNDFPVWISIQRRRINQFIQRRYWHQQVGDSAPIRSRPRAPSKEPGTLAIKAALQDRWCCAQPEQQADRQGLHAGLANWRYQQGGARLEQLPRIERRTSVPRRTAWLVSTFKLIFNLRMPAYADER